jgi:DNA polymerase
MPVHLSIDIETYSATNLISGGVHKYAEDPDFEILMLAYSYDFGPVHIIDIAAGEQIPEELEVSINNPAIIKHAHNAQFETVCLSAWLGYQLDASQWRCTMVQCYMLGLPGALEMAGPLLKLSVLKDKEGKALIRFFTVPQKTKKTKTQAPVAYRNYWHEHPEKWQQFKSYCMTDVAVEQGIYKRLSSFKQFSVPAVEWEYWGIDQRINQRGVKIDKRMVQNAVNFDERTKTELTKECLKITGAVRPSQVKELKKWLLDTNMFMEYELLKLNKETLPLLLRSTNDEEIIRVLEIRQEIAKTSVKKYHAIITGAGLDGRVRGLLQFYGAGRTGRDAGRRVQVQNLPKNDMPDLDYARQVVVDGDYEWLHALYGNTGFVLSQLIRTSFIADKGKVLVPSDFSAIEACVIAWFAGEEWRLRVFREGGDIYKSSYSRMFGVLIEEVTKAQRQIGKVGELALGYQGGENALMQMDVKKVLHGDQLRPIKVAWRKASPNIVSFWKELNALAVGTIQDGVTRYGPKGLKFFIEKNVLFIQLPSGRCLSYVSPTLVKQVITYTDDDGVEQQFEALSIRYMGIDDKGKWSRLATYGGKLAENIVQATARDLLWEKVKLLEDAGYPVLFRVHDEIVMELPTDTPLEPINEIMAAPVKWAPELPLKAVSFSTPYYKKED